MTKSASPLSRGTLCGKGLEVRGENKHEQFSLRPGGSLRGSVTVPGDKSIHIGR